jgi:kanamycin kinase
VIPAAAARLLDRFGERTTAQLVWRNEIGGLTFRLAQSYLKWTPADGPDTRDEAARLRWLDGRAGAPLLLDAAAEQDGSWLLTRALDGENAVSPRWLADPTTAVRAIGEGLRALHDELPVAECPFSWGAADRYAVVVQRVRRAVDPAGWHPEHRGLAIGEVLERLGEAPGTDLLVVCHGDACAPNTLLDRDGRWSGHVDFDSLGVGDRWADLAVATWSTSWNYGPGWERALLDAYGIDPDPVRTAYYRLLWDLGP